MATVLSQTGGDHSFYYFPDTLVNHILLPLLFPEPKDEANPLVLLSKGNIPIAS